MSEQMNDPELKLWIATNHPELVTNILNVLAQNPDYDYADAVDRVDSKVYNEWYETE